jgi:hypothetical protein
MAHDPLIKSCTNCRFWIAPTLQPEPTAGTLAAVQELLQVAHAADTNRRTPNNPDSKEWENAYFSANRALIALQPPRPPHGVCKGFAVNQQPATVSERAFLHFEGWYATTDAITLRTPADFYCSNHLPKPRSDFDEVAVQSSIRK